MNEVLFHTNYLDLKSTSFNDKHSWVYAHRPNAKDVVIILATTDDEVLFVIEKRPPIVAENKGEYTIGLAAGLVGDERKGETIIDAVKAELLEETGLVADKIEIKANKVASSAGCLSETCNIVLTYIKDKTIVQPPIDDNGVIVDRIWVKKTQVHKWLNDMEKQGYVLTSQALAALFYLYE